MVIPAMAPELRPPESFGTEELLELGVEDGGGVLLVARVEPELVELGKAAALSASV